MTKLTTEDRFWAKVRKADGCWLWVGAKNSAGYGNFWDSEEGRQVPAHRYAYQLAHGPIPVGMMIDHQCHTPACVNHAHLRLATRKQNGENRKGAQANNRSSGVRGVTRDRTGWRAQVKHNGKLHFLGIHPTIAEAEAAVTRERERLFTFA